jgi:hypothetical protein
MYTSNSFDEMDANPPQSPGRLGYRSIPPAVQRPSSRGEELVPDSSLHDRVTDSSDVFQRENSATSLHSNDSSESLEDKKNLVNSPSITSSGYHSDEIHTTDTVTVNGDNSPPRVPVQTTLPASPSVSTSSVSAYDATRYQDETSRKATLPSVSQALSSFTSNHRQFHIRNVQCVH